MSSPPYRILLAAGASALLLTGCNDSSSSSDAAPAPPGTEQPGNPDPVVVPALRQSSPPRIYCQAVFAGTG